MRLLSWALPLAVGAFLLCLEIGEPWTGSYDANGALFSTAARNYLRYGLLATRGGQVVNAGQLGPGQFRFYAHHPPGLPLTIAASFAVFGVREWSARLVAILFTLGAAALLHLVAKKLGGPWAGFFAALVFVMQPMIAFYGRMPDHEAPAAFFALALVAAYLQWLRQERKGWLVALCALAFAGLWYAWVVFLVPWLLLGYQWLVKRRGARWLILPAATAALGLVCLLAHVALVEGSLRGLWGALAHRLGSQATDRGARGTFGLADFLTHQAGYFWDCFSVVALAACAAWVLGLGRRKASDTLLVLTLAVFALLNLVVFKQGAYVHIYYQFYLALPMALAAGLGLGALCQRSSKRRALVLVALVLAAGVGAEGWVKLRRIRRAVIHDFYEQTRLARFVRRQTSPDERLLVVWAQQSSFRQLTYYGDRNITVVPDRESSERLVAQDDFDARVWYWPHLSRTVWIERLSRKEAPPARPPGR